MEDEECYKHSPDDEGGFCLLRTWEFRRNLCSTKERKNMLLRGSWSVVFSFSLSFLFRAVAGGSEIWNRAAVQTGLLLAHHTWLTLCQSRHKRKRRRRRHTARPSSLSGMRLRFTGALGTFVHFPLFMAWYCVCLCVSVCVCECVCLWERSQTQTGWAGTGHGPLVRLDPSRGTKQGRGGGASVPSPPKSKTRFGFRIRSKCLDPFLWSRGSQEEERALETIIKPTTASEDWAACSREAAQSPSMQHQSLSVPLWSLLTFVLCITWSDVGKANLYAFCNSTPPRIPQEGDLTGRSTPLATGGNGRHKQSQKHMMSFFELLRLCAIWWQWRRSQGAGGFC